MLGDRLAPGLPLLGVGDRLLQAALDDAEGHGHDPGAFAVEHVARALAGGLLLGLAEELGRGDVHLVEEDLARRRRPHAHLAHRLGEGEAGRAALDDEGVDRPLPHRGVAVLELGVHEEHIGEGGVGDERLLAAQHVAARLAPRRRAHPAEGVRARAWLGDRPGANLLPGDDGQAEAAPLLHRPSSHDRPTAEPERRAERHGEPRRDTRQLDAHEGAHRGVAHHRAPRVAVGLDLDALSGAGALLQLLHRGARHLVDAEGGDEAAHEIVGKLLLRLQRVDRRDQVGLDPLAQHLPHHLLLVGEVEHRSRLPRDNP